jgi:ABC-2 type transport system permease protein
MGRQVDRVIQEDPESPIDPGDRLNQSQEIFDSADRPHPLVEEIQALVKYRDLIVQFISRSIKTRYKRSFLGVVWTMLNPLLTMIVLTLVFSQIFRFSIKNYPVYVLSGLVLWIFFSTSTSSAMGEMLWSGSLLGRIYVPKSVFSVSAVGTGLVNLLLSLIPLFLIAIVLQVKITPAILVMPFSILLVAIFALGVGLLLSTAVVYFADVMPVYEVILVIWMYTTPIIYSIDIIPENIRWLFKLNPLYHMMLLFREPLYNGIVPPLHNWLIAGGFALTALILGGVIFTSKSNEYAYRI